MSDYYDITKPYSLEDWNKLVQEINARLQDPEGDCMPVDPLTEATAPHVWKDSDVEEVRDKMIETCAGITFEEDLELWHPEIIDEIVSQLDTMWCDCLPRDIVSDIYYKQEFLAGYSEIRSETTREWAPCAICVGEHCAETQYIGAWFPNPHDDNDVILSQIYANNTACNAARYAFCFAVNRCQYSSCKMEYYQSRVDYWTAEVDRYITQYEAAHCDLLGPEDPEWWVSGGCDDIIYNLKHVGNTAALNQVQIDTWFADFQTYYPQIEPKRVLCDQLAAENMALCLSLQVQFIGVDENLAHWFLPEIKDRNFEWWKWFNPNTDNLITNLYYMGLGVSDPPPDVPGFYLPGVDCAYKSSTSCLNYPEHTNCDVRPYASIGLMEIERGYDSVWGSVGISPDGTPFLTGQQANWMLRSLAMTYELRTTRCKCETIVSWGCLPTPGNCGWGDWSPIQEWWWNGRWIPFAHPSPDDYTSYQAHIHFDYIPAKRGKDYDTEKTEFYATHNDWYTEHPKYDNRHNDYS